MISLIIKAQVLKITYINNLHYLSLAVTWTSSTSHSFVHTNTFVLASFIKHTRRVWPDPPYLFSRSSLSLDTYLANDFTSFKSLYKSYLLGVDSLTGLFNTVYFPFSPHSNPL